MLASRDPSNWTHTNRAPASPLGPGVEPHSRQDLLRTLQGSPGESKGPKQPHDHLVNPTAQAPELRHRRPAMSGLVKE